VSVKLWNDLLIPHDWIQETGHLLLCRELRVFGDG